MIGTGKSQLSAMGYYGFDTASKIIGGVF